MRFLTWCNKIDERSALLFASAKHFGIDLEPIGLGREYRGGVSKIEWLHDYLTAIPKEQVVCCTDSHDVIYLQHADHMEEDFQKHGSPILYAGEKWYRKRPLHLQSVFDERCHPQHNLYRYPNGGAVVGIAGYLHAAFSFLRSWAEGDDNDSEQWHLTRYAAECPGIVLIDYACKLFWCCAGQWRQVPKLAHIENGRLTNLKTGGQPYVLHSPIPNRSRALLRDIAGKLGVPLP